jgi:tetratricopeptide (TPR) repeat protein
MRAGLLAIMAAIWIVCLGLDAVAEPIADLDRQAEEQWRAGDFAKAAALRRQALDRAVHEFGPGSRQAGTAIVALAQTDLDRRRYLDAEPLLLIAARLLSDADAPSPILADVFAGLARIAVARGSIEAGEHWAQQALAAVKDSQPATVAPLLAMAAVRAAQERFADSETLLRQALSKQRQKDRPDGEATARILSQLGTLDLRQQRYAEALPLLEQAAAIDRRALAPTHPFIADDFYDLGLAFDGLKRPDPAQRSLRFAIKLLEHGPEKDSLRLAYAERELARILRAADKGKDADAVAKDSRRILDKIEEQERDRERGV